MISKNLFWANCKENHKRRIWVWIISVLGQLMAYVGILMVYLTRIRLWYSQGMYSTYEEFHDVMCRATVEAMGFQEHFFVGLIGLAAIIGIQGFSYLHDRRKVDLYHSVPVDKNRRFAVVYLNGIMIYLAPALVSVLIGIIVAAVQDAVNGWVLAELGIAFVWNLLFFLVIYHTVILSVMLTGNRLITICMAGLLLLYEIVLYELIEAMQRAFFDTFSMYYVAHTPKLSAVYDYFINVGNLDQVGWNEGIGGLADKVLPYCGKWLILAVVILAAAWLCYRKRPSEAAGRAIAFVKAEPVLKAVVVIPVAIGLGMFIHNASYGSTLLTAAGMVTGGVIACAAMEVIYDFDIKSLLRHPVSGGVTIVGIALIFVIYRNDLLGYDKYVPSESKVDSIALLLDNNEEFWSKDFNYYATSDFGREHMFLTDIEPVLTLADKWQQERERFGAIENVSYVDDTADYRRVYVMYRLKSGREVERKFYVNYADSANEELLNRIVGTEAYKEGAYQIMTDSESFDQVQALTYSNGAAIAFLHEEDAQKLRDAYVKDMEKFDFSLAIHERPCGRVDIRFPNYKRAHLDVYESFENTIAYLQSQEAYYPIQLNPEDIEDITITRYYDSEEGSYSSSAEYNLARGAQASVVDRGSSYFEGMRETFYDQEQFAQIIPAIYPSDLSYAWHNDGRELDSHYDVYVTFKKDTTYPYARDEYGVGYKFYLGQAPDFVVEATALGADAE